jgi:hypothetical protein
MTSASITGLRDAGGAAKATTGPVAQGSNSVVPLEQKNYRVPPMVRMVNTKRITLNFEVRDVGPSGVAGVELWYTQDCKDWRKYDAPPQAHSYIIEVEEEGMYGFTLVARSGLGLAQDPPTAGDLPQIWVMVDLTRPEVQLTDVSAGLDGKVPTVTIQWKASDKNLGRQPVSLDYAASEEGPWQPIATNLDSVGRFVWRVPAGAPSRIYIRAQAADLSGNVGVALTEKPVLLGTATPQAAIVNVMPGLMPAGR